MAWVRILIALIFIELAGCVGVPGEELTTYREAFVQVKDAGQLLYGELDAAVGRAGGGPVRDNCEAKGTRAPSCFDPRSAADRGGTTIPAIRARLLALETITLYNLAIVDLLEGRSGDALRERVGELHGVAKDLLEVAPVSSGGLPALLAGPAAGMLAGLVERLDNVRTRQVAAQSLKANAPTIRQLISLLIDDTRAMYDLYLKAQGKYAVELELAAGSNTAASQAAYARIGAYHEQLTAYVKVLEQTGEGLDRLIENLQGGSARTSDATAVIREAIEIRIAAEEFWAVVRKSR